MTVRDKSPMAYYDFKVLYLAWKPCPRGVERVHSSGTFAEFIGRMDGEAFMFAAAHLYTGFRDLLRNVAEDDVRGEPWKTLEVLAEQLFRAWALRRGLLKKNEEDEEP